METSKKKKLSFKDIMMMIWIFIKALVRPKYAYRFRNMYLFLPVILLVISWILLPIPIQSYMRKNGRSEFINRNINNVDVLYDLDEENYQKIKNLNLTFDLKIMTAANEAIDSYEFIIEKGNDKLYIVVDLCELDSVRNRVAHYDYVNFFDTYVNEEGTNTLLVLYNSKFLIRSKGFSNYYVYENGSIDLATASNADFANYLVDAMVSTTLTTYGYYAALYALVVPLALCLFTFIIFKTNGRIKKFRNYFNVCGIASVIPTLLVFIFSWIFPELSLIQFYAPIYLAYYFFFIGIIKVYCSITL